MSREDMEALAADLGTDVAGVAHLIGEHMERALRRHQFEWSIVWPDRAAYEIEYYRYLMPGVPDINIDRKFIADRVIPASQIMAEAIEGWLQ
jgi:hypothetical protein